MCVHNGSLHITPICIEIRIMFWPTILLYGFNIQCTYTHVILNRDYVKGHSYCPMILAYVGGGERGRGDFLRIVLSYITTFIHVRDGIVM